MGSVSNQGAPRQTAHRDARGGDAVTAHIRNHVFHVELLSPKQNSESLEEDLEKFAVKYRAVIQAGHVVCIPDNPMGKLAFQGTELIQELALPVAPGQVSIHLNTFHSRQNLELILDTAVTLGIDNVLVISGDGSERLPKLPPADLDIDAETVSSVELLEYVHRAYPNRFTVGVAFNPYEPQEHEMQKLRRKIAAGAQFVTTQPIIGDHPALQRVKQLGVPLILDAWMSKRLHLLSDCVGYEIPATTGYDPIANLRRLVRDHPGCGFYLALLGFKTQFPLLDQIW